MGMTHTPIPMAFDNFSEAIDRLLRKTRPSAKEQIRAGLV